MLRRLAHRGPDGEGLEVREAGAVLAHTRLAVIDPPGGSQPMANDDGTVWIVYNGEVYNFRELRDALAARGARFRTRSDTEVVLRLYEMEGLRGLARLSGMYAFAIWDEPRRRLLLARDPWGMKPLHYFYDGERIVFASEIKAVLADPAVPRARDLAAFHDFLNLRFVPAPATLLKDVRRVRAGHLLLWERGSVREERFTSLPAWRAEEVPRSSSACEELIRRRLAEAVERHLVSDVPLGAYLSGGLDSTSVVALALRAGASPLPTFTLGFGDASDETDDARAAAAELGTVHHEETLDAGAIFSDYARAVWHVEEPQVNILQSFRVAALARRSVKVVLSGLGGDELFGGYHTHRWMAYLRCAAGIAAAARGGLARARQMLAAWQRPFGPRLDLPRRGLQLLLAAGEPAAAWAILRNCFDEDPAMLRAVYGPRPADLPPVLRHVAPIFADRDPLEATFDAEIALKLEGDFLAGEDRTSMAHGLEVRMPFLDLAFAKTARSLPLASHVALGRGKALYRRAVRPLLPRAVRDKKKWGFSFDPIAQWDRAIAPYVRSRLDADGLERIAPVDPAYVRRLLDLPAGRTLRWHRFFLWMLAGYVDWHRFFIEGGAAPEATS